METYRDEELIGLFDGREREAAFAELFRRYGEKVYRLVFRILHNREDAEDAVQEVFLNIFRKIDTFRGDASLSSWIYRIAANTAFMKIRQRKSRPTLSLELPPDWFEEDGRYVREVVDFSQQADQLARNHELRSLLIAAVNMLPDSFRLVFFMKDIEGMSNQQIANALGLSVAAVKSRLHRARLQLREQLHAFVQGSNR